MNRKELIISLLLIFSTAPALADVLPQDSLTHEDSLKYFADQDIDGTRIAKQEERPYDRRVHRYRRYWGQLIPTSIVAQNAGNMGVVSVGMGWEYGGHEQWETQLLFGYIPKFKSSRGKLTITLKQNYIPWSLYLKNGCSLEPLRCGLYLNTVAGHEFWKSQPGRYPDKYYAFLSTKFRINVFVGQGVTKVIPVNRRKFIKSITAFYEISTCDLYIRSIWMDSKVSLIDILGLSLGVKLQML